MTTTKQVTVDNSKGQGTYGLGGTWAKAAENARSHWRESFGTQKPVKVRLSEYEGSGRWRTVVDSMPFVNWKTLQSIGTGKAAGA